MEKKPRSWRTLQTVERATEVIRVLSELDGAGVSTVAERLDMSVSSAHSQLATLHETGYLIKEDGQYKLSYTFLLLGEYVRNSSALFQFGRPEADRLADETGHHVHLFTEERGLGVNIYESRGEHAGDYEYQSMKLQHREPLHVTASGKAILASMDRTEVRAILNRHGLEQYTENTITDEQTLFEELDRIQEQGYAVNNEEEIRGFRAVAAPVQANSGTVIGSISVAGPARLFDNREFIGEFSENVVDAANMIQVSINMSSLDY
ncbi:IclR family transcriptional regulator [Salinigranum sp. GCM10025319]|uniref:IclR family transcriptional regulator n=1 Tax=Salinigranum sp. GCM10025319 TaxID=3252687 RepID=UPI00361AB783